MSRVDAIRSGNSRVDQNDNKYKLLRQLSTMYNGIKSGEGLYVYIRTHPQPTQTFDGNQGYGAIQS